MAVPANASSVWSRFGPLLPPPLIKPLAVVLFLIGIFGANPFLAVAAVLVLVAGGALLWRPGESPILLFIFLYQWLQASLAIFHANWNGVSVSVLSEYGGDDRQAIILTLIGLLVVALGMRLGAGPWRPDVGKMAQVVAVRRRPKQWFRLYLIAWFGAFVAKSFVGIVPGLTQPLLAAASLKWAFFFMLGYATLLQRRASRVYWLAAFMLELALSLGGFFSSFKTVFFFSLFAFVAAGFRLSGKRWAVVCLLTVLLLGLGIVWTAIKVDYRSYVSGGTGAQVVTVSYQARMRKLGDLVSKLDRSDLDGAVDDFLRRIAYVSFFGRVVTTVPRVLPHEGGAIWWDALRRPFMPRLLFPGKSAISDSERTAHYTGLYLGGPKSHTSISIGYIGEAYIDVGKFGMMPLLLGYGFMLGLIYRGLTISYARSRGLLGMGLASAVLIGATALESSATKVVGSIVVSVLVSYLLVRFVIPWYLPWLQVQAIRRGSRLKSMAPSGDAGNSVRHSGSQRVKRRIGL